MQMKKLVVAGCAAVALCAEAIGGVQLAYLTGNGTAYVTTDYTPNPDTDTIVADVELCVSTSAQCIFSARNVSTSADTWTLTYNVDGKLRYDFGKDYNYTFTTLSAVSPGRHCLTASKNGLSVDGIAQEFTPSFEDHHVMPGGPLWMFAMGFQNNPALVSSMTFYSLKVLQGDAAVHHFVPMMDDNHCATIGDIVGDVQVTCVGEFVAGPPVGKGLAVRSVAPIRYRGAGRASAMPTVRVEDLLTGATLKAGVDYELDWKNTGYVGFAQLKVVGKGLYDGSISSVENVPVVARLPDGYVPLEYIESTGKEYIDLESRLTNLSDCYLHVVIAAKDASTDAYPSPFGARESNSSLYKMTATFDNNQWGVNYGAGTTVKFGGGGIESIVGDHVFEFFPTKGVFAFDGQETAVVTSDEFEVGANAYLFAFNDLLASPKGAAHLVKMKLSAFSLWEGGKVKRDLVPCRKAFDGSCGVYDLVSKRFFENKSGSGAFTGGPEMPKLPNGLAVMLF